MTSVVSGRISRRSVLFTIGRLLPAGLSVAAIPILSRHLGTSGYGELALLLAASGLVTSALFGWAEPLAIRELANTKEESESATRRAFLNCATSSIAILVAISIAVAAILLIVGFTAASAMIAASSLAGVGLLLTGVSRATDRGGTFIVAQTAIVGGRSSAGIAAVLLGFGVPGYFTGWTAIASAGVFVLLLQLGLMPTRRSWRTPTLRSVKYASAAAGVAVALVLLQLIDRLILSSFVSSASLGIYALGYSICETGVILLFSIMHSRRFPALIRSWDRRHSSRYRELEKQCYLSAVVATLPIPVFYFLGERVIRLVGGPEFETTALFVVLVAASLALYGPTQWLAIDLQHERRTSVWLSAATLALCVNIVLTFLLAPSLGIVAGSVATFGAYGTLLLAICLMSHDSRIAQIAVATLTPPGAMLAISLFSSTSISNSPFLSAIISLGTLLAMAISWYLLVYQRGRSVIGIVLRSRSESDAAQ